MGYAGRISRVSVSNLRKYTAKSRRRRTANTTKVKYQRPTARNQQRQIMTNAVAVRKIYRSMLSKRVFCDWQYVGQVPAKVSATGAFTKTWACFPLTDYTQWQACLREDDNVTASSTTFVQRMCLNFRYALNKSNWAQFNVWVVTSRKDAAGVDAPTIIAGGTDPTILRDYVEGPSGFNIRLNSAIYKVHFASYRTMTENALFLPNDASQQAGNPNTTWAKGQANIKCNANVRYPISGGSWKDTPYMQQGYAKRYFLLVNIVCNSGTAVPAGSAAEFSFDQLATTINDS